MFPQEEEFAWHGHRRHVIIAKSVSSIELVDIVIVVHSLSETARSRFAAATAATSECRDGKNRE